MTKEEKQLLLVDLCARLPYGVIVETTWAQQLTDVSGTIGTLRAGQIELFEDGDFSEIIPYLRPLSSMTEEEKIESLEFAWEDDYGRLASYNENIPKYIDWLNKHHFDYRGLIEIGLALEAKEGTYEVQN